MTSMRPLGLNHQTGGQRARRAPATMVLLLALAGNIAGGMYYADLGDQRAAAAHAAVRRDAPVAPGAADHRRAAEQQAELARGNDTVRGVNVPWDEVFGALEAASSADVSLLAFDPTPEKKMIKLTAEARSMDAALLYLRALAAQPSFASVSLQSHQVQQDDSNHPVRILVLLEWRRRS